jgi:hypothetical protein
MRRKAPADKHRVMTTTLHPKTCAAIDDLVIETGVPRAEVIRAAVEAGLGPASKRLRRAPRPAGTAPALRALATKVGEVTSALAELGVVIPMENGRRRRESQTLCVMRVA